MRECQYFLNQWLDLDLGNLFDSNVLHNVSILFVLVLSIFPLIIAFAMLYLSVVFWIIWVYVFVHHSFFAFLVSNRNKKLKRNPIKLLIILKNHHHLVNLKSHNIYLNPCPQYFSCFQSFSFLRQEFSD